MKEDWFDTLDAEITICNKAGIITYLNRKSASAFIKYGGFDLVGKSLFDCHNDSSKVILKNMMETEQENIYTIEKAGEKKLICQKPIYEQGSFAGIIEISLVLPDHMPHHIRD